MTLFPLDSVRNARPRMDLEPMLEEARQKIERGFPPPAGKFSKSDALEVFDQSRARLNIILSALDGFTGKSGIDIGTGFGILPTLLKRRGIECAATEIDENSAFCALSEEIEVRPYRIGSDKPPFTPECADFLVLSEVIEHLPWHPIHTVREVAPMCRAGARLVLTTPNVARLQHVELLAAGENFQEPFSEEFGAGQDATRGLEHVREYSVRETVDAVEGAGFEVDEILMTGWGESGYQLHANPFANDLIVVLARR